jgi:5-methylcytosine-specific restriction protein A
MPLRPCLVCGVLTKNERPARCDRHQLGVGWRDRPAPLPPPLTYKGEWPALSKQVLRDEPVCRCGGCGVGHASGGCRRVSVLVDHVVSIADGGARLDRANLQALCRPCHDSKSATDFGRRRRRRGGGIAS